eukprot:c6194_g1_i2.p1 GENE.c6194_g1_i2~~c6194_g1_i2.p1  ORF type:complete len:242 (-),score=43.90 c6194_g1_i2:62-787(-)
MHGNLAESQFRTRNYVYVLVLMEKWKWETSTGSGNGRQLLFRLNFETQMFEKKRQHCEFHNLKLWKLLVNKLITNSTNSSFVVERQTEKRCLEFLAQLSLATHKKEAEFFRSNAANTKHNQTLIFSALCSQKKFMRERNSSNSSVGVQTAKWGKKNHLKLGLNSTFRAFGFDLFLCCANGEILLIHKTKQVFKYGTPLARIAQELLFSEVNSISCETNLEHRACSFTPISGLQIPEGFFGF